MKIVVGLGNPEKKYEKNFHNIGFAAADRLAAKLSVAFKQKAAVKGYLAEGVFHGEKFIIVKPVTYMNLSGECVQAVLSYYKASAEDLIIIYDDLDVAIGEMRFRPHGSAGSHNGMKNVVASLGTEDIKRIRVGIKKYNENIPTIDYVLSDVPEVFRADIDRAVENAADCAYDYLSGKAPDELMQKFNGGAPAKAGK